MYRKDDLHKERIVHIEIWMASVWRGWSVYRENGPCTERLVYV